MENRKKEKLFDFNMELGSFWQFWKKVSRVDFLIGAKIYNTFSSPLAVFIHASFLLSADTRQ